LLESHSPDLPLGVEDLADREQALAGGIERHHGDELHVDVFTLHVNTPPVAHEPY
jgi:hypothetical protein